jgi:hypothetical protein
VRRYCFRSLSASFLPRTLLGIEGVFTITALAPFLSVNGLEAREIYRKRQAIIEHPFGTTKKIWGFNQFLCRTKEKTTAEQSLVFLAYNLRRVINIFKDNGKYLAEVMG